MGDWPVSPISFQQNPYGGPVTLDYLFDSGTANADPGAGKFRLNNATENTATALFVNVTSFDGVALAAVLDNLTNSTGTNKAMIRLVKKSDTTAFLLFYITGETTHTGYREFAVAIIASSAASPFSNGDECLLAVGQIGDAGPTGAPGPAGQWYEGAGAPSSGLGINNDMYLDTSGPGSGLGLQKIAEVLLGADAASVSFSSIPQTYRHLWAIVYGRVTEASTDDYVYCQFNGDTGANYDRQHVLISNNTTSFLSEYAQTRIRLGDLSGANASRAGQAGMSESLIPHYAGTTFEKVVMSSSFLSFGTSSPGNTVVLPGGGWRSTAAINQITFLPAANNFKAGSLFTLYGIP